MNTFTIPHSNLKFSFTINEYNQNGNTAINLWCNEENFWEPYCNITVNLDKKLAKNEAFIDVNNIDRRILWYLQDNGFLGDMIGSKQSGYVLYPLYRLNLDKIKEYELRF